MKVSDTKLVCITALVSLIFSYLFFIAGGERIANTILLFVVGAFGGVGFATWYEIFTKGPYKQRLDVSQGSIFHGNLSVGDEILPELRGCPFCKQLKTLKVREVPFSFVKNLEELEQIQTPQSNLHVSCLTCGANGPTEHSLEDVKSGWNLRRAVSCGKLGLSIE